jgi:hypothetical protein
LFLIYARSSNSKREGENKSMLSLSHRVMPQLIGSNSHFGKSASESTVRVGG